MIQDTLNDIIEAETKAELSIQEAGKKATEISESATNDIEKLRSQSELAIKEMESKILTKAQKDGDKQAILIATDARRLADSIIKNSEKKIEKAVEYVAMYVEKHI